jgi:toxin ParE1/3/4
LQSAKLMRVHWAERAEEDLLGIITYIAERNVKAAQRLEAAILATIERIAKQPRLYRLGRTLDTREAVVTPNYIIVYEVDADQIVIRNVLHARQQYP